MDFHRKALVSSVHAGAEEAQLYPCSATHLSRWSPPPSGLSILTCGMRATGLLPADLHVLCCSNSLWTLNTVGTYVVQEPWGQLGNLPGDVTVDTEARMPVLQRWKV